MSSRPYVESPIEYLAWFRFPVTWTYISGSAQEAESVAAFKPLAAAPSLTLAPIVPAPPPTPVALDVAGSDDGTRPTGSAVRWEMMVPKMAYPPSRPAATLSAAAAPALAAPTPRAAYAPTPVVSPAAPVSEAPAAASIPSQLFGSATFSLHTPEDQFVARYWSQIVYVAIAVVAVGCLIWGLSGSSPAARSATSSSVHTASWSRQPVAPSGRSLTVYEPSRSESDYRMEFSWVPDAAGVGWVFRTRDGNNYYAARLSLQQSGANGVLVAEHFGVFGGAESTHSRKVIPLDHPAGLTKFHMDAIGSAFKLFVEDKPADSWTDSRLKSGALGFFDDGDRLPKLLALSFTFMNNSVSRTAVVPLP